MAANASLCNVAGASSVRRSAARQATASKVAPLSLGSSFTQGAAVKVNGFMGNSVAGLKLEASSRSSSRGTRSVTAMAAKVSGYIKLAIDAGKANPSPPIGPALGAQGVNIMQFCKEYNAATQDKMGTVIPVEITVYADKSFTFVLKTPPASVLLKKYANVKLGAPNGAQGKVGEITMAQLKEIAEIKMPDLNANDIEAGMKIVKGTADNMGIKVSDWVATA